MGQPTYVGNGYVGSVSPQTTQTLTHTTTGGNLLLLTIMIVQANPNQQSANVVDSQGNNAQGIPKNRWVMTGAFNVNGTRVEQWTCKSSLAVASITVNMSAVGGAAVFQASLLEYSAANGVSSPLLATVDLAQNQKRNKLIHQKVQVFPNSGAAKLIAVFVLPGDAVHNTQDFNSTPLDGTQRAHVQLATTPTLAFQTIEQGTVDPTGLDKGLLACDAVNATYFATAANMAVNKMMCVYFVISGGLLLNVQPGFNDQADTGLAADKLSLGGQLAKISGNAAFGMVRMEFFQQVYKHGDTVALPVSPVDGYAYSRSECSYIWTVYSSANPSTGWITGPDTLWYCGWAVDQTTGLVFAEEWYRTPAHSSVSNDGFLQVFTITQRQQTALILNELPTWSELDPTRFAVDGPVDSQLLTSLNNNAKFACVGAELVYMGEFYDGQTVPKPISPADGWDYTYAESKFIYSWRWTTTQASYARPAWVPNEQLGSMFATISSVGVVACRIGWARDSGEHYFETNTDGRIAVWALCQRTPRWTVPNAARAWDTIGGKNSSFPYGTLGSGTITDPLMLPTIIPVTAGHTYTLQYLHDTILSSPGTGSLATNPDGLLSATTDIGPVAHPTWSYTGSQVQAFAGLGCYTDAAGNIVGIPFHYGTAPINLTIPGGATQIQLGVNYDNNDEAWSMDPAQFWTFNITRYSPTIAASFAEIAQSIFYPGALCPASIGKQLYDNCQEAALSPEFFGPTFYVPGDVIPLPVSPIDGYTYKRSELTYIREWKLMEGTTPGSYPHSGGDHVRCPLFSADIDQSTGTVSTVVYRLAPGGPYYRYTNSGTLCVTVIGFRTSEQSAITTPVVNPPSDALTTTNVDSAAQNWTVNGV